MKQWLLEQNTETHIILAIALTLALFAVYLLSSVIRQTFLKHQIESRIAGLGLKQLCNITIDDGMDGKIQIERVLLTARGILALSSNFLTGNIFGDDKIDTWAQVINKRTYRFPNPLYNFEHTLSALKYHFNDLAVDGKILFVGECAFPTGQPLGALLINDLEKFQFNQESDEVNEHAKELWDKFERSCEHSNRQKIQLPDDHRRNKRLIIAALLLIIAILLSYSVIYQ